MAKVIELCGIAGSGKSTIYKALISKYNKSALWIPGHFLYPKEKLKFDNISKFLFSIEKRYFTSEGNTDDRTLKKYGDRFLSKYPEFMDACWKNIFVKNHKNSNGVDLRFDKARYLDFTIQRYQYLKENNTMKATLLDEGLVQRVANGLFKTEDHDDGKLEIHNLLNLMPFPDALIHVHTDIEVIATRLLNRRKVILNHQGLSLPELADSCRSSTERMTLVTQHLEHLKVPILHINSSLEIKVNVNAIIDFIEDFYSNPYNFKK